MVLNLKNTPLPSPAVEHVTTTDTGALFGYKSGSINELIDELKEPKQPFTIPDLDTIDNHNELSESPEPSEPSAAETRESNRLIAQTILGIGDGVMAFMASLYGHKDASRYRLPHAEYKNILPHLERCIRGKNVTLSPGWALVLAMLTAYLPIALLARADRNEWNESQEQPAAVPSEPAASAEESD